MTDHINSNTPPSNVSSQSSNINSQTVQYQQVLRTYQQGLQSFQGRVDGANGNIQNTQREIRNLSGGVTGFFAMVSGTHSGLEAALRADILYRDQLQSQLSQRQQTLQRAQTAARQGDHEAAMEILRGNEEERRQRLLQIGRQATQQLQSSSQQLAQADVFLSRTETVLRTGQRAAVITAAVGATVMTGGAGAPLLVTALYATAAGTGISALTNLVEAEGHAEYGNMSRSEAFGRAGRQIGNDALLSAQIGVAGGTGYAVGGIRALGSLSVIGRGMIAGGAGGFSGSLFQTVTGVALGRDDRTCGQIVVDTGVHTVIGAVTGGIGTRGQTVLNEMAQRGTNTLLNTTAVRAVYDVAAPTVIGVGATALTNYLTGRNPPTLEQAAEQAVMAIVTSTVGANVARNQNSNVSWRYALREQLTTPTFNSIGNSLLRRLIGGRTLPPPALSQQPSQTHYPVATSPPSQTTINEYQNFINRGVELIRTGHYEEAIAHFRSSQAQQAAGSIGYTSRTTAGQGRIVGIGGVTINEANFQAQLLGGFHRVGGGFVANHDARTIEIPEVYIVTGEHAPVFSSPQLQNRFHTAINRESALLHFEEYFHALQNVNRRNISTLGQRLENIAGVDHEADVAIYLAERHVDLAGTHWIDRYNRELFVNLTQAGAAARRHRNHSNQ